MRYDVPVELSEVLKEWKLKIFEWFELIDRLGFDDYNFLERAILKNGSRGEYNLLVKEVVKKLDKENILTKKYNDLKKKL